MTATGPPQRTEQRVVLTDRQREVFDAIRAVPRGGMALIGYGGAMGGGKTACAAEVALSAALADPGVSVMIGRKHFEHLKTTTMAEFDQRARPWIINSSRTEHWRAIRDPRWPEGVESRVYMRGVDDFLGLGSEQLGTVVLDEAGEIGRRSALMLLGRLRHPAASRFIFYAASNPWPGWFEDWFVKDELPTDALAEFDAKVTFIPAFIRDNPHLRPSPEAYEARMRALYPQDWVRRMVEGSFLTFEGQVHGGLGMHLQWPDTELPQFSRLVGGLDFGGANPAAHKTAGVVAGLAKRDQPAIGEGEMVRFAHFEDASPSVHADLWTWMRGVESRMKRRVEWCADKSQMWGISLAKDAGFLIEPSHGGADSVAGGINLQNKRIEDGASYFTEALTEPPSPNARSWYDSMLRYRWKDQPDEDKQVPGEPIKRDDDTPNADRYMHESADGFPVPTGPAVRLVGGTGHKRATRVA